ncbi:hypothetical protein ACHAP4_011287 [Fusarium culmorum]
MKETPPTWILPVDEAETNAEAAKEVEDAKKRAEKKADDDAAKKKAADEDAVKKAAFLAATKKAVDEAAAEESEESEESGAEENNSDEKMEEDKKKATAKAAMEKARLIYEEAVQNAMAVGVVTDGMRDDSLDDYTRFRIPGEWREEGTAAWGEIKYNTDKGYLLVYESFGDLYRAYMISRTQYPFEKKKFLENKGPRLDAQIVTAGARGHDDFGIFDVDIEAIAVLWGRDRVQRVLVTLREPHNPEELLLYNVTTMRARWGAAQTTKRLYYEFLRRNQEPVWYPPERRRANGHQMAEQKFFEEHRTAIENGKEVVKKLRLQGLKVERD